MPYLSLPNFNYDSGPRRIQSGPDHEGYIVLYSGVQSTGPDEGVVVAGAPLSGTITQGAWDYDANWRYVPSTLQTQSGAVDPTPYNASGALDTYDGVRISTRNTVAGAQIASAIGPQPGSTINRPEKYMYFGGAAPDNQNYSPYNTPEINLAAEGKTGGGVTHRTFESSLLTNVLGSQGTSDRSQWRYHQPVYCKTYTETRRSEVPGLMSTPLRAVYRGGSTSYSYNYGGELAANRGGFELLSSDYPPTSVPGSGTIIYPEPFFVTSTVSGFASCAGGLISWYRVDTSTGNRFLITQGSSSYTTVSGDIGFAIEAEVGCPDPYSPTGFGTNGSAGIAPVVLPAFNTTLYNYARFIGTKIGRYIATFGLATQGGEIIQSLESNAPWLNIGNNPSGSFLTVRFPVFGGALLPKNLIGPSISDINAHIPWVANFDSYASGTRGSIITLVTSQAQTYIFRDGSLINNVNGVSASNASISALDMFIQVRGKWQFKQASSLPLPTATPDAEWTGVVNSNYFNSSASFSVPVSIPPYFVTYVGGSG